MASATWRTDWNPEDLSFITMGAVRGAHIFRRDVIKRMLVDSLNTGRILGQYELFAFVVMPNHMHIIVRCLQGYSAEVVTRELKKATSNLIIRQYEAERNAAALAFCASCVKREEKQAYAVWRDEYQAKDVFSAAFLRQKMTYIHNNPLQPHWALVDAPEDYVWSSARFYLSEGRAVIPLSDARALLA